MAGDPLGTLVSRISGDTIAALMDVGLIAFDHAQQVYAPGARVTAESVERALDRRLGPGRR